MLRGDAINTICISLLLVTASAVLTHLGVRYACGAARLALLGLALGLLAWSFHPGRALGGFWPGVYALLSGYFLACIAMPWLDLAVRRLGRIAAPDAEKSGAG